MPLITNPFSTNDPNNTTTALLNSDETFTGIGTASAGYDTITICINSDINSSNNGLNIYFSDTLSGTYVKYYEDNYISSLKYVKSFSLIKAYYYVTYKNSNVSQSLFNLSTYLMNVANLSSTVVSYDSSLLDLTNKLQTTESYTLLDIKYNNSSLASIASNSAMIVQQSSGGAFTSVISQSCNTLTSTGGIGNIISQSKKYANYQPGKTFQILMTGVLNNSNNNIDCTSRMGYYDNNNGLYFSNNETGISGLSVNLLNNSTLTTILRENWNGDKLDGTGYSGINLDFSKAQLFIIQFLWLGIGQIKFQFNVLGKIITCHTIFNYNTLTMPWCSNPNLPIRYELLSSSISGTGSMIQICSSVQSIGGYNPMGRLFSISTTSTPISVTNTETVLLAITGCVNGGPVTDGTNIGSTTNTYYHQTIRISSINVVDDQTNDLALVTFRIFLGGNSLSSSGNITWTDVNTNNSIVKYATAIPNIIFANSIIVYQVYVFGRTQSIINSDLFNIYNELSSNVSNQCDVFVVTAKYISGSSPTNVYATINWNEIY